MALSREQLHRVIAHLPVENCPGWLTWQTNWLTKMMSQRVRQRLRSTHVTLNGYSCIQQRGAEICRQAGPYRLGDGFWQALCFSARRSFRGYRSLFEVLWWRILSRETYISSCRPFSNPVNAQSHVLGEQYPDGLFPYHRIWMWEFCRLLWWSYSDERLHWTIRPD